MIELGNTPVRYRRPCQPLALVPRVDLIEVPHGLADVGSQQSVTEETQFRVASVTKMYLSASALFAWPMRIVDGCCRSRMERIPPPVCAPGKCRSYADGNYVIVEALLGAVTGHRLRARLRPVDGKPGRAAPIVPTVASPLPNSGTSASGAAPFADALSRARY